MTIRRRRRRPQSDTAEVQRTALPVRDSKNPKGPRSLLGGAEWRAFLDGIKDGGPR
ncbi:DUF397 domain-containing protein [Sphaerisporangium rhizosphaerae]|uniref:DUF397 domain-containing protein n=1 Tax=Sphaerisporangium rhizosphaerae TaxID=2269375 RepID=A0ABW2PE75_9ACTN